MCNACVCVILQRYPCGLYPRCFDRFCGGADCGPAAHNLQEAHRGHTWSQDVMFHTHTHARTHACTHAHTHSNLFGQRWNTSVPVLCQWWLGHMENIMAVWIRAGQQHCGYPGPREDRWANSIWKSTHTMHIIIQTTFLFCDSETSSSLRCGDRWASGTFQSKEVHLHRRGPQAWAGQSHQCRVR